ncbi:cytochrome P450 [Synechococcus sp. PCC 7502]|uniref:cytochrome P450 n=1 Tax=Synechococcus sp. PCC 7502 TaxID=1173263 RepID=UPI00029FF600|nr:cytochrome P450 [Synechococcus sp. PCC 7502]AFY74897.1 cytochrome P450 [Synechococcus sp. PCC 7502]
MTIPPTINSPKVLQLWKWIVEPLDYLHKFDRECGDIFTVNMSSVFNGAVFVSHPQAIQQVLTSDTKQFSAPGSINQILKPFLGDRGVILLDGREHRQRRQLLMPQFHGDKVRNYTNAIQQITRNLIAGWQVGEKLNVRKEMEKITLSVILQTVFGLDRDKRYDQIREKLSKMLSLIESPINAAFLFLPFMQKDLGAWSPWRRFVRDRAELDRLIYDEISDHRQNSNEERSDILSMLISSQDSDGNRMSDLELHDELMTLLFAGHETTATALAWAIYWINYLPEVKQKLLTEIATLGTEPDAISLSKLPYLNAVCAETLRIYPVGMLTFPRITNESISIRGYEIKPNTVVMGCIYLTHHREDTYPDPHLFKPERFLERQFSPYEYLPFGGGSRRCVGMALAQLELKLVIVEILSHCQLQLIGKLPIMPVRRGVTLAPNGGVSARVKSKYV